jgi:Fur family zinc uptake transcriptional regulator
MTKNQRLVFDLLETKNTPMTAYAILDELHDDGLKAPPQVYRALDKLVETGRVHRLESLNAFLACRHPGCDGHDLIAFGICETCGRVEEFSGDALAAALVMVAGKSGFSFRKGIVEVRGNCAACR